ncbi:MAG: hypothetical protein EXR48_07400 [Dehalococcoidia bacterium]|nr:hypothetical protein [Dehalococcoidia bacterium]
MPDEVPPRYQTRIRDLSPLARPRERLRDYGARMLSNAELLAILLRTGSNIESALDLGNRLLASFRGLGGLARAGFPEMVFLDQESLRLLLLNTKNQVLKTVEVYKGNVNAITVRAGEALRHAVRENCPAVILVHNHPSGDPAPSQEDIQMTRQLVEAGKMLDVEVLDHVVVARNGFVSLRDRKLGFGS